MTPAIFRPTAARLACLLAFAGFSTGALAGTPPQYHLVPIEIPGAVSVYVASVNDARQAVGYYLEAETYESRAFLWDNGTVHVLGLPDNRDEGSAAAINNLGQIVGTSARYTDEGADTTALLWEAFEPEAYTIMGENQAFKLNPAAINDLGVVAGLASADGHFSAFTWTYENDVVDYGWPDFGPATQAYWSGINDAGDLVGGWNFPGSPAHAIGGKADVQAFTPLAPDAENVPSMANAINNHGVVAGSMTFAGPAAEPATFVGGVASPVPGALLGLTSGSANGLNDAGVIVGRAINQATLTFKAFVHIDGASYDLATLADNATLYEHLLNAVDVNAEGAIAGLARGPAFSVQSFIAVPVAGDAIFADGFDP
ncbi:hypothetical protein ACQQ2N_09600 [Dokdonella sp. MW10]|uniref:hypothetical protein n=1 Tax=Dokdonella sp. MW10 TaxID=2992926 RepID=UPI003F81FD5B